MAALVISAPRGPVPFARVVFDPGPPLVPAALIDDAYAAGLRRGRSGR